MSNLRLPFPIMPAADGEPSHYARYGVGGLHYVGTVDSLSGIPENLKEPGMLVFVSDTHDLYTWTGLDWVPVGYVQQNLFDADIEDIKNLLKWVEFE